MLSTSQLSSQQKSCLIVELFVLVRWYSVPWFNFLVASEIHPSISTHATVVSGRGTEGVLVVPYFSVSQFFFFFCSWSNALILREIIHKALSILTQQFSQVKTDIRMPIQVVFQFSVVWIWVKWTGKKVLSNHHTSLVKLGCRCFSFQWQSKLVMSSL